MKKVILWFGILVVAVLVGVLGFRTPGPLVDLPSKYRLGMIGGGVLLTLLDVFWAYRSIRGWWRRRGEERVEPEKYGELAEGSLFVPTEQPFGLQTGLGPAGVTPS